MTIIALQSKRRVNVAVHRSAGIAVGSDAQPQALAGDVGADQALSLADGAPRAIALQVPSRTGMAFAGDRRFTAIGAVAGQRGKSGPAGNATPPVAFSFGDASPRLLRTLDDAALLSELKLIIDNEFDGEGAVLRLRADSLVLMDFDQNAPAYAATYETTPGVSLPAGTGIYIDITPGSGATSGAGQVLLNLH